MSGARRTASSRGGQSVRKAAPSKKVTHKSYAKLNQNGSAIASVIDVLRGQLAQLEQEIRADRKGVRDFKIQLEHLHAAKVDAEKRLVENNAWAAKFDKDIGPFERMYHTLTLDIHGLYENASRQHQEGVDLLKDAFDYHPEFKRFSDTFSSVPFRPSKADAPPEHATAADALAATRKSKGRTRGSR